MPEIEKREVSTEGRLASQSGADHGDHWAIRTLSYADGDVTIPCTMNIVLQDAESAIATH